MSLNGGTDFQGGMSLSEGKRIDHREYGDRDERTEAGEAGAATRIFGGDGGSRISRMRARRRTVPTHRSGTQAFWLWKPEAGGEGRGAALSGKDDGLLPTANDAPGDAISGDGSAEEILASASAWLCPALHRSGRCPAGRDRQLAQHPLRPGDGASDAACAGALRRYAST